MTSSVEKQKHIYESKSSTTHVRLKNVLTENPDNMWEILHFWPKFIFNGDNRQPALVWLKDRLCSQGDSGGPMAVRREDDRFMLSGIISWGIGCAEKNQPGVYTRISEFKEWINQILQY